MVIKKIFHKLFFNISLLLGNLLNICKKEDFIKHSFNHPIDISITRLHFNRVSSQITESKALILEKKKKKCTFTFRNVVPRSGNL